MCLDVTVSVLPMLCRCCAHHVCFHLLRNVLLRTGARGRLANKFKNAVFNFFRGLLAPHKDEKSWDYYATRARVRSGAVRMVRERVWKETDNGKAIKEALGL